MADTNPRTQPYKAFRFLVEIEAGGAVVGAFTNFSGIKMNVQMVKARTGYDSRGVKDNYPGITQYENVTLTKGVIGDNEFLDWLFNSTFPSLSSGPRGAGSYRNLNIVALNDAGERGVVWTLQNAIPAGYELTPMDASQSAVLTEQLEFSITGVKRSVSGPNKDSVIDPNGKKPQTAGAPSLFRAQQAPTGAGGTGRIR